MKRASEPRFCRSEALSHTWWQVKDSNLRSFRDGFTVPRLQDRDQRKRLTHNNFRAYSPQIADDHRLPPDTSASDSHSRRRATRSSRTLQTGAYPARANTSRDRLSGRAPPRQDRFTRIPQMAHIASLPEVTEKRPGDISEPANPTSWCSPLRPGSVPTLRNRRPPDRR